MPALDHQADLIVKHVVSAATTAEEYEDEDPTEIGWEPQVSDLAWEKIDSLGVPDETAVYIEMIEEYEPEDEDSWYPMSEIENHYNRDEEDVKLAIKRAAASAVTREVLDRLEEIGLHQTRE